jgi:hypothetical protein
MKCKYLFSKKKKKSVYLKNELNILKTIDHPNVIKFFEVYHDN